MTTLLEKVKCHNRNGPRKPIGPEDLEIALAYISGHVSLAQCCAAYGKSNQQNYGVVYRMLGSLRHGITTGTITIAEKP
jgi:hypothetical protein